ncbi:uncharacterized protein YaeQ [Sinobacterium caligoides]|uniref:Uncharacterized protein YaeQ n=1 Tax=Sinobacterium caligoides TaxID=933926 RepID=A0A3N2DYF4_9GAMM|nr:YaeQ family protein [Sinobacterium caligoides]ROS04797.1 uncharacterized protein YaeQ [Sinobacterium caligoides]
MALKSTVYKIQLQVSDMNRHYYAEHHLSVACHPSESLLRMLTRIIVFGLNADEKLTFGRGLSEVDDAPLWLKDDTGEVKLWIEVGSPSVDRMMWLRGKSDTYANYSYQESSRVWWAKHGAELSVLDKCEYYLLPEALLKTLTGGIKRQMKIGLLVTDDTIMLTGDLEAEFLLEKMDSLEIG